MPVARWVAPEEFDELKRIGEAMGIGHVEASPLTRSSYHAKQAASGAVAAPAGQHPVRGPQLRLIAVLGCQNGRHGKGPRGHRRRHRHLRGAARCARPGHSGGRGMNLDVATPVLVDRVARGPSADGGRGRRRAPAVDRSRPALPHRLCRHAVGAAHDVRAPARRRGHAGRAPAGGATRGRAARGLLDPAVGGDRGPDRPRRPPRQGRRGRRHRRPHLGPVPGRPAGGHAVHHASAAARR